MVRLDGVGLQYDRAGRPVTDALRDVTFAIPEGGFRWLLGPSGAGKSTVFQLLLRFFDPVSGAIRLDLFKKRE